MRATIIRIETLFEGVPVRARVGFLGSHTEAKASAWVKKFLSRLSVVECLSALTWIGGERLSEISISREPFWGTRISLCTSGIASHPVHLTRSLLPFGGWKLELGE